MSGRFAESRPSDPDVFISYASADLTRAERLHERLVAAGFSVWFDRARLVPGCDWHREIGAGCDAARVILPLLTPAWKLSEWTRFETYGHSAVVPLIADGTAESVLTPPLRRWQAFLFDPLIANHAAWKKLFVALRAKLAEPVPEKSLRIVNLPYPANPFFTGRDADLLRIHEELQEGPVAALTQSRVRALAAMGGVGKTTLANEYARHYWRLYSQILWVDARRDLTSEYALLFDRLFPARVSVDISQREKAQLALKELSGPQERLLVLDNVADEESVRPWLPTAATTGCRTLITSRYAGWPVAAGIRSIPLLVLEPEPSHQFLLSRTGRTATGSELVACHQLAHELGYLPLALEQAAAYIAVHGTGVSFAQYLRLYQAASDDLLARGALGSTEYPDPVITTWQATMARLSPDSRAVLNLCAWLADTPIPSTFIIQGLDAVLTLRMPIESVEPHRFGANGEIRMRDALAGLARYSMILDSTDMSFRVHNLVQTVVRFHALGDGTDRIARQAALKRLAAFFPATFDPSRWPCCGQLLPHCGTLLGRLGFEDESLELATLLTKMAGFLTTSGNAAEACPLIRRALDMHARILSADDAVTLTSVHLVGYCLHELGNSKEALPFYYRALNGRERVLGAEHPSTISSRSNLATCIHSLGHAAQALPIYREVLRSSERILGESHPDTILCVNNLAQCLRELRDTSTALQLTRLALERSVALYGREDRQTLAIMHNLASCLRELGQVGDALALNRQTLDSREHVLGPEHPDTLGTAANLVGCMVAVRDLNAALTLGRRTLEICERVLGPEHLQTLHAVQSMAETMHARGNRAGAALLYRRALEARERILGVDHSDTVNSLFNLARSLHASGEMAEALPFYQRMLDYSERTFGANHPETLQRVDELSGCLYALGDYAAALQLCERALLDSERIFGANHPKTREFRQHYAKANRKVTPKWRRLYRR